MKRNIIIFVAVILIVLSIGGALFYYYAMADTKTKSTTEEKKTSGTQKSAVTCSPLKADNNITSGPAPFAPVLRATISGKYEMNKKICVWSIDGSPSHSSYPVKSECIFGGKSMMTKGEHEISYKLSSESGCGNKIKVTVQ